MLNVMLYIVDIFLFIHIIRFIAEMREKRKSGIVIEAKVENYFEIPGRPKRYVLDVFFKFEKNDKRGRVISYDKNAKSLSRASHMSVIYVAKNNKVYWAKETIRSNYIYLSVLLIMMVVALFISVVSVIHNLLL